MEWWRGRLGPQAGWKNLHGEPFIQIATTLTSPPHPPTPLLDAARTRAATSSRLTPPTSSSSAAAPLWTWTARWPSSFFFMLVVRKNAYMGGSVGRSVGRLAGIWQPSPSVVRLPSPPPRPPGFQVAERVAASSIGFGNPVRARGAPSTIAAQSAALQQVRGMQGVAGWDISISRGMRFAAPPSPQHRAPEARRGTSGAASPNLPRCAACCVCPAAGAGSTASPVCPPPSIPPILPLPLPIVLIAAGGAT